MMDSHRYSLNSARIKKLNDAEYIKLKLWSKYLVFAAFFVCLGALVYHMFGDNLPFIITETISSTWLPTHKYNTFIDFFVAILYKSVDIFKISFIILIGGFTYISDVIINISNAVFGVYMGVSLCFCFDMIMQHDDSTIRLSLVVTAMMLCCLTVVSNCVWSALTSQKFSQYRNVNMLLTSEYFWRYIGKFLISFGYILIVYIAYVLIFEFIG